MKLSIILSIAFALVALVLGPDYLSFSSSLLTAQKLVTRAETLKWPSVARAAAKKQHLRTPDAVRPARVCGLPIPVSVDVNTSRLRRHAWINRRLPRVSRPRRHTRCSAPVKYLRASERPDLPEVVRDGPAE